MAVNSSRKIHWIGAGLVSGPGIIALAEKWGSITVWGMNLDSIEPLQKLLNKGAEIITQTLNVSDDDSVQNFLSHVNADDVVISMLPPSFHVKIAQLAMEKNAHMVNSSYLTPEMEALNDEAVKRNITIVSEVGLDPGIDHLFAHLLIDHARKAGVLGKGAETEFVSYCGGIPAEKTDFTYKFNWAPTGVLISLSKPAQALRGGEEYEATHVWDDVSDLEVNGEMFEVYPNRNSLPYIKDYGLENESNLQGFVRGTLRYSGWKKAWSGIFTKLLTADASDMAEISSDLLKKYSYAPGEQDRVVMYVALKVGDWQASFSLNEVGSDWQSAMARTVSFTVVEAVMAVLNGEFDAGVNSAPHDPIMCRKWLTSHIKNGMIIEAKNIEI